MNYEQYVGQLNKMYDDIYCNKEHGNRCIHWEKCKPDEPVKFCFDRVKVGKEYGTIYPKILFSGLEGKHGSIADYRIPEIAQPGLDADNSHYMGVRYVLSYLLSGISGKPQPLNADKTVLSAADFVEHLKHYALTNLYKCAFGKPEKSRNLTHTPQMQRECYKIFLKEIDILKPDIIVIQVVTNRPSGLWAEMLNKYGKQEILLKGDGQKNDTSAYLLQYEDRTPFYCIWTYHGSGRPHNRGKAFGENNIEYIEAELNPVLDTVIEQLQKN